MKILEHYPSDEAVIRLVISNPKIDVVKANKVTTENPLCFWWSK